MKPTLASTSSSFLGDFLTRFSEYLAGIGIDDVLGDVLPGEILVTGTQGRDVLLVELAGDTGGEALARLEHDFAGIGVDQIRGPLETLHCAPN